MVLADTHNVSVPASARPFIPGELLDVSMLARWMENENRGDRAVGHVCITSDVDPSADFSFLELSESRVVSCSYAGGDFTRSSISDVAFVGCDFSNCDFTDANFTRCTFASCKGTGANFTQAVLSRVELRDSAMSYASFTKAKLEDVSAGASDFSHTDIAEARLKRVAFDDVRFVGATFFRTSLSGIDMTTCHLADMVLSDDMAELSGCIMDWYQAAGIAQRLGVVIKD